MSTNVAALARKKVFSDAITEAFPAILAEREAAQRLRDDLAFCVRCLDESPENQNKVRALEKIIAAFDKETQNEIKSL